MKISYLKSSWLILLFSFPFFFPAFAQTGVRVAASAGTADPSAMLDVVSSSKGVLVPRMLSTDRTAIASPATGLLVFQTDGTPGFYYNAGTPGAPNWVLLSAGALSGVGVANKVARWTTSSVLGTGVITDDNTNVGIGTTSPQFKLDVNGNIGLNRNSILFQENNGSVATDGTYGIYWHSNGVTPSQAYAIYRTPGAWTGNTYQQLRIQFDTGIQLGPGTGTNAGYDKSYVDIINGKGLMVSSGSVGIGTTTPSEKLHVKGNIIYQGVKNVDGVVSTYEITTKRYYVSGRYGTSAGKTIPLDMSIISELCGDEDGCRVRAYMRFWSGTETEGASDGNGAMGSYLFTYDASNGHWRFNGASGVDGSAGTQHAISWFSGACYFTDGSYNNFSDLGDGAMGMGLLIWNGAYTVANRTCELIFED